MKDRHLLLPVLNLLVVVALGVVLLVFAITNRSILVRQDERSIRDACSEVALKKHPNALQDPAELRDYVVYAERCARLNGVSPRPDIVTP